MVKIRDVNLTHISNCKIYECVATTLLVAALGLF